MTDLRYLPDDDDVTEFEATVTGTGDDYVILDGTYFYPGGGGQPADRGTLSWSGGEVTVVDARKNHGDVRHYVDGAASLPEVGTTVDGRIDAERRGRLTRLHTAQHVLSRIVLDEFGAATVGNGLTLDGGWVEFEGADLDTGRIDRLTNAAVDRDLPVHKAERPRDAVEDAVPEGRAQLDRIPDHVDPMRVVEIDDFDVCPCGGTHVDRLGELGTVRITAVSSENGVERIEFDVTA
ncbi:alanyl-tRNA editing protein [Haloplanus natans]|uniref:alanyl-tRNA editing protein n=1 Tax=Haloplanus natans TaxID=376171 RepID=UPI0006778E9F|nr:alanyl-tRNA editing protein [Haloplanus natans]